MKPAGRERNIEVAMLKNINTGIGNCQRHKWNRMVPVSCNVCGMDYKDMLSIKRWSTDRNAAGELWDELPLKKEYTEYEGYGGETVCLVEICYGRFYGKDFADCVSQAWITWKEDKKCD